MTVEILDKAEEDLVHGFQFYERRPDKGYSLTDCISMVTMRRMRITEVLTNDHHFEQEGYVVLISK